MSRLRDGNETRSNMKGPSLVPRCAASTLLAVLFSIGDPPVFSVMLTCYHYRWSRGHNRREELFQVCLAFLAAWCWGGVGVRVKASIGWENGVLEKVRGVGVYRVSRKGK